MSPLPASLTVTSFYPLRSSSAKDVRELQNKKALVHHLEQELSASLKTKKKLKVDTMSRVDEALDLYRSASYNQALAPVFDHVHLSRQAELFARREEKKLLESCSHRLGEALFLRATESRALTHSLHPDASLQTRFLAVEHALSSLRENLRQKQTKLVSARLASAQLVVTHAAIRDHLSDQIEHINLQTNLFAEKEDEIAKMVEKNRQERIPLEAEEKKADERASRVRDWRALETRLRNELGSLEQERKSLEKYDCQNIEEMTGNKEIYW